MNKSDPGARTDPGAGFEGAEKNIALHNVKLILKGRKKVRFVTLNIRSPLCSGTKTKQSITTAVRRWTKGMQAAGGVIVTKIRCTGTAAPSILKFLENTQWMGEQKEEMVR